MHRRTFIASAAAAAAAGAAGLKPTGALACPGHSTSAALPSFTIAAERSGWLADVAQRFATRANLALGGAPTFGVAAPGEPAPADALVLSAGDRLPDPALSLLHGLPYYAGLPAADHLAWLTAGGGADLVDALALRHDVKPLALAHGGRWPGLWSNRALPRTISELKAFTAFAPGLSGAVLKEIGAGLGDGPLPTGATAADRLAAASPVLIEGASVADNLSHDVHARAAAFDRLGVTATGALAALYVPASVWEGLGASARTVLSAVAAETLQASLAESRTLAAAFEAKLKAGSGVSAGALSSEIGLALSRASDDVVADLGRRDRDAERTLQSFMTFRKLTAGLDAPEPRRTPRAA